MIVLKNRNVFLLFIVSFLLIIRIPVSAGTSDLPKHIHLTWQREDTAHTITVTWHTNTSDAGDTVLYDIVPRDGNLELYRYSAQGTNHTYSGDSGYIHDVELAGLIPNTTYYFICGGDTGGWSSERAFRTAPIIRSNVRFVVGGDCRTDHAERDKVSQIMSRFNPGFVILIGDMVEDGNRHDQWDSFFNHMKIYWVGSNGLTIPIIPALGNHEKNSTYYYEQFSLPSNEQWYSLDLGPDIHIIILNSEADPEGLVAQTSWLEEDLEAHASYLWKFVVFHRNVFTSDTDAWTPAFDYWVPLFDKYHVDVVCNGHAHNYMRTKPINWIASNTTSQSSYLNGTMYLVSGGWGAPLHEVVGGWWVAYNRTEYNFVLIDIFQNGTLYMQAKDDTGKTFDEVWVYKSSFIIEELMAENKALKAQIVNLQSQISSLISQASNFQSDMDSLQEQIETLNNEVTLQQAEIASLKEEVQLKEESITSLENQLYQMVMIARFRLIIILILGTGLCLTVAAFLAIEIRRRRKEVAS